MTLPQVPIPALKPMKQCPFCGHSRIIFGHDTQPKYTLPMGQEPVLHFFMFCNNCRAQGPAFTNDHPDNMPFDEWNSRVDDKLITELENRIVELEGIIIHCTEKDLKTCLDCKWWDKNYYYQCHKLKDKSAHCGPDFGCIHFEDKL